MLQQLEHEIVDGATGRRFKLRIVLDEGNVGVIVHDEEGRPRASVKVESKDGHLVAQLVDAATFARTDRTAEPTVLL